MSKYSSRFFIVNDKNRTVVLLIYQSRYYSIKVLLHQGLTLARSYSIKVLLISISGISMKKILSVGTLYWKERYEVLDFFQKSSISYLDFFQKSRNQVLLIFSIKRISYLFIYQEVFSIEKKREGQSMIKKMNIHDITSHWNC